MKLYGPIARPADLECGKVMEGLRTVNGFLEPIVEQSGGLGESKYDDFRLFFKTANQQAGNQCFETEICESGVRLLVKSS